LNFKGPLNFNVLINLLDRHIKNAHTEKKPKKEKQPKSKSKSEEGEGIFKEKLTGINCPYCNKFLTSRHSLNDHIRVKHSFIDFEDMYLCDVSKTFNMLLTLSNKIQF